MLNVLNVFLIVKLRYCNNLQRDDVRKNVYRTVYLLMISLQKQPKSFALFFYNKRLSMTNHRESKKNGHERRRKTCIFIHGHLACCIAFSIAVSLDYTLHQAHALVVFIYVLCFSVIVEF